MIPGITASVAASSEPVLFIDGTGITTTQVPVAHVETATYGTQGILDPGKDATIIQVAWSIKEIIGSAVNWVTEIWTMDGEDIDTLLGTSDQVSITGIGLFKFPGLSVTVSNGTDYGISLARADHGNGTNYCAVYVGLSDTIAGNRQYHDSSKVKALNQPTQEFAIGVYE